MTQNKTEDDRLNEQDLQNLLSRLSDPDKTVRAEAACGLAAAGRSAIPACIALLQNSDWKVRYRAAEVLGLIGDGEAYAPLTTALDDGKDHVRYMAAKGLGLSETRRPTASVPQSLRRSAGTESKFRHQRCDEERGRTAFSISRRSPSCYRCLPRPWRHRSVSGMPYRDRRRARSSGWSLPGRSRGARPN